MGIGLKRRIARALESRRRTQAVFITKTLAVDGIGIAGFQYVTGLVILGAKVAMGAYTTYLDASLNATGAFGFSAH